MKLPRTCIQVKTSGSAGQSWPVPLLILGGCVWIFLIVSGFFVLEREEFTPVQNAPNRSVFPPHSAMHLDPEKLTLFLFVHPLCPCTRASLQELIEIRAATSNKLTVLVVFTIPAGVPPGWEKGDLWTLAVKTKGLHVVRDQDGEEARRFGARGSGHVLLYNPIGELLFSGGITPSRGREGNNLGHEAVIDFVLSGYSPISRTPVFGCSLL